MRKPIIIIVILLVLAIGAIFYISMQRDTTIIVVKVTLAEPTDNKSEHIISQVNASLSHARKMEVPEETALLAPGITVVLIQDMQVQSGWYSVGIPAKGIDSNYTIYGNYEITIKPYKNLNLTRPFTVLTRVIDPAGKEVSVRRIESSFS